MEVQKLRPNLFLLTGGNATNANTVVFVRSNGVTVIDTKGPRPHWGSDIADQVKSLTRLPITTVINTTGSADHTGGNPELAWSKVEIIAHENATVAMRQAKLMFPKPTGGGLPTRTFKDRLTVGSGPDRLELYYFGPAHMHSDIFVVIPALRVLLTGDAFAGKFLPALSRVSGGDGVEYPNTLTRALPLTRDIDMIIPGHGGSGQASGISRCTATSCVTFWKRRAERRRPARRRRPPPGRGNCRHGMSATRSSPPGYWGPWSGSTGSCHSGQQLY